MPVESATAVEILDISVSIFPKMPVYPGDPGIRFEQALSIEDGGAANVTHLHLGSQTGTHFDTPHHILNNGSTAEQIPLETCHGPALVIEIPHEIQAIDEALLRTYDLAHCARLLLKTRNSAYWQTHPTTFIKEYAALTGDGAQYLAGLGIQLVGIDYLSIELFGASDLVAHKALLSQEILILEGVNLASVEPGPYTLIAFPLKYQGLDGAPTRAVLLKKH